MLNHLIIPRNHPNVTCFSYICFCIGLLLYHCMVILYWPLRPYTQGYYCFVCNNPRKVFLLSVKVDIMVLGDCMEVARAGGRHSEGVITTELLVSTLLLLCKFFLERF